MKYTKKIAALILTAFTAVSFLSLSVYAENTDEDDGSEAVIESEESEEEEIEYITSGDYRYYVATNDNGENGAVLEEYTGSDTEIVIPDTIDDIEVKALGDFTFYLNDKITKITISKNIEEIGQFPFYGCTSLMEFKVDKENEAFFVTSEDILMSMDGLCIMSYPIGKNPEKYTVTDGIEAIHSGAFAMCSNLKEITFPESLEYIGIFAFAECTSLESAELPDSLTELQDFTFSSCTSLTDVKLPANLSIIHDAVFFECKALKNIDFPSSLYEIGQAAFCSTGITSVTIPATVTSIDYSAFGFHTDENEQIVADDDFVIRGYTQSSARAYCLENEIKFVAIDDEPTENSSSSDESSSSKKITTTEIAVICIVCAAAIIAAAFVIVKKTGRSSDDGHDDDENDDESDDESDYESAEEEE